MAAAGAVLSFITTACTVIGVRSASEQPLYDVVGVLSDEVEIRAYGSMLAAETTVISGPSARNDAFRRLAGYIFGANSEQQKIAMTSPVVLGGPRGPDAPIGDGVVSGLTEPGEPLTMRFLLPAALSAETAPLPTDPAVTLRVVPAKTLAVRRFSGSPSDSQLAAEIERLLAALASAGIVRADEPPIALVYDPPWTVPALRRNEVAVAVVP